MSPGSLTRPQGVPPRSVQKPATLWKYWGSINGTHPLMSRALLITFGAAPVGFGVTLGAVRALTVRRKHDLSIAANTGTKPQ